MENEVPSLKISREKLPDSGQTEIEIYPDGDKSRPRIGVLKIEKGMSRMTLDPEILPYQSMNESKK
jgi:hypothetical protein